MRKVIDLPITRRPSPIRVRKWGNQWRKYLVIEQDENGYQEHPTLGTSQMIHIEVTGIPEEYVGTMFKSLIALQGMDGIFTEVRKAKEAEIVPLVNMIDPERNN